MKASILAVLSVFSGVYLCLVKRTAVSANSDNDCQLHDKYFEIGGDKGNVITVNVGECRKGPLETSAVPGPSTDCVALRSTEERHLLFCGYFVISAETIQSCQKVPTTCQRLSHFVTYYSRITYNRTIDVGACGGMVPENMTCKSVRNQTEGISTPNGIRLIPKIVQCASVKPYCYRVSSFEAFPEQHTGVQGKVGIRTKLVDMGRCVGEGKCPRRDRKNKQLLPDFLFPKPPSSCTAETFKHHSFVTYGGRQVNVSAIATCACRP